VVEGLAALEERGVKEVLIGGWGIDALVAAADAFRDKATVEAALERFDRQRSLTNPASDICPRRWRRSCMQARLPNYQSQSSRRCMTRNGDSGE
jgi:predicted acylesterase/phospholipase RssA